MTNPTHTITQRQVNDLLKRLEQLYQQIHRIRKELASVEKKLADVYREYQAAISHLQLERYQLEVQIAKLQKLFDRSNQSQEGKVTTWSDGSVETTKNDEQTQPDNKEDIAKDMLHEHIYRVLAYENDELLTHLQAICSDPTKKLVDVLEQIPWGTVWTNRTTDETRAEQYQRLTTWQNALQAQLDMLERTRERHKSDPRYGLWLEYQKGKAAWNHFLKEHASRIQDQNKELKLELQTLRKSQGEMENERE